MKKNISINISGIIFHIEEDGYETLKKYLDSINKYFSTFEDSSEILADIESRIAEIFLSKLNEEKQVITAEDVSALVTTMGSVSDFKAAEEQESEEPRAFAGAGDNTENTGPTPEAPPRTFTPSRQLYRDQKRKILGGVCAGLGNYFSVDPLWIRLLFAVLFFAYGFTLFVYIIMWIVVPGSFDLDEPVTGKKMFRDPERKIIGGVSGGVAAFLGIDVVAVRVIFIVFTLLGGLGLFIYIVLWLILPEARTLTDRVQMQGEPVTLSNIESTIKKSQIDPGDDESTVTKVLLFPFRLIGMILTALGSVLRPLVEVIRVAIGIFITLIGLGLALSIIATAGILFGIFSAATFSLPWMIEMNEAGVPMEAFVRAFPGWTALAGFIGALVPSVFLILLGVSVIAQRIVFTATAGWTLFVLFFVSAAVLAVGIPRIVLSFHEEGEYRVENVYAIPGKTALLRINEIGMDGYDATNLSLRGYDAKDFKLVQEFEAQGITRAQAIEHAKMVSYNVDFRDSTFYFDSNITFNEDAIFRAQRLKMTLYIPYDFPFIMDEGMARFINEYVDCCGREGTDNIDRYRWKMTRDGLVCIDCPGVNSDEDNEITSLRNFSELEISGKFDVKVIRGDQYKIELIGSEREKSRYNIYRSGEALVIEYTGQRKFDWKAKNLNIQEMRINVTMPELEKIEATGYGTIRFDNFRSESMEIESRGPIRIRGEINGQRLNVRLTGNSEVELSGDVQRMNARLEFASSLRAYDLEVDDAIVEVSGASNAKVHVVNTLEIEEGVASEVDYRGQPNLIKRD